MRRQNFANIVEEALAWFPGEFRRHDPNVAVLVEDMPPHQPTPQSGAAKTVTSGYLPWRAHDEEERI